MGSHISFVYGAWTPGVFRMPSRTSCVAIPHGTPTVTAMAECPWGVPYSSRVEVIVSYYNKYYVSDQSSSLRRATHFFSIGPLYHKLVLEHHQIALTGFVLHKRLHTGAQGIE